eukprot:6179014-Pleurochrysis_carterae.AAC.2
MVLTCCVTEHRPPSSPCVTPSPTILTCAPGTPDAPSLLPPPLRIPKIASRLSATIELDGRWRSAQRSPITRTTAAGSLQIAQLCRPDDPICASSGSTSASAAARLKPGFAYRDVRKSRYRFREDTMRTTSQCTLCLARRSPRALHAAVGLRRGLPSLNTLVPAS